MPIWTRQTSRVERGHLQGTKSIAAGLNEADDQTAVDGI